MIELAIGALPRRKHLRMVVIIDHCSRRRTSGKLKHLRLVSNGKKKNPLIWCADVLDVGRRADSVDDRLSARGVRSRTPRKRRTFATLRAPLEIIRNIALLLLVPLAVRGLVETNEEKTDYNGDMVICIELWLSANATGSCLPPRRIEIAERKKKLHAT